MTILDLLTLKFALTKIKYLKLKEIREALPGVNKLDLFNCRFFIFILILYLFQVFQELLKRLRNQHEKSETRRSEKKKSHSLSAALSTVPL